MKIITQYRTLNSAAANPAIKPIDRTGYAIPRNPLNRIEVWYATRPNFQGNQPFRYHETHTKLGEVKHIDHASWKDHVFLSMQGEEWSPRGEANDFLKSLGVNHTSMSVGDVIIRVTEVPQTAEGASKLTTSEVWMAASVGWTEVKHIVKYDPYDGEDIAQFLGRMANIMDKEPRLKALEHLQHEHRTIQQSIAGFCMSYLSMLAAQGVDARNAWAVEKSKDAVRAWGGPITPRDIPII